MPKLVKLADNVSSPEIINDIIDHTKDVNLKQSPRALSKNDTSRTVTDEIAIERLNAIGQFLDGDPIARNAFITELFNVFVMTLYEGYIYQNKLQYLEKGQLPMGWGVRDIFVEIASPYDYLMTEEAPKTNAEAIFASYPPSVRTAYFHINYRKNYRTSTYDTDLRAAFVTYDGVRRLIFKIIQGMYDGMAWDEELAGRYVLSRSLVDGNVGVVTIPTITTGNGTQITTTIKEISLDLDNFSTENNAAHVLNHTPISEQLLIVSNKYDSAYTVEVQSAAFNLDKVSYLAMKRTIRSFSFSSDEVKRLNLLFANDDTYVPFTNDELVELEKVQAVLMDKNYCQFYRNYQEYFTQPDRFHLNYQHILHIWKIYALSPFSNVKAFVSADSSVTSVSVSPTALTISNGQSGQLTANVKTVGFASKSVVWEILEPTSNSTVSQTGVVKVGVNETYSTLHVKVTSSVDISKTAQTVITIPQPGRLNEEEQVIEDTNDDVESPNLTQFPNVPDFPKVNN